VPVYSIFVSSEMTAVPFSREEPPRIGGIVTPDETDWLIRIDEAEGDAYLGVRI
jgi:hypothetical protein